MKARSGVLDGAPTSAQGVDARRAVSVDTAAQAGSTRSSRSPPRGGATRRGQIAASGGRRAPPPSRDGARRRRLPRRSDRARLRRAGGRCARRAARDGRLDGGEPLPPLDLRRGRSARRARTWNSRRKTSSRRPACWRSTADDRAGEAVGVDVRRRQQVDGRGRGGGGIAGGIELARRYSSLPGTSRRPTRTWRRAAGRVSRSGAADRASSRTAISCPGNFAAVPHRAQDVVPTATHSAAPRAKSRQAAVCGSACSCTARRRQLEHQPRLHAVDHRWRPARGRRCERRALAGASAASAIGVEEEGSLSATPLRAPTSPSSPSPKSMNAPSAPSGATAHDGSSGRPDRVARPTRAR